MKVLLALPAKVFRLANSDLDLGAALTAATNEASGTKRPGAISLSIARTSLASQRYLAIVNALSSLTS